MKFGLIQKIANKIPLFSLVIYLTIKAVCDLIFFNMIRKNMSGSLKRQKKKLYCDSAVSGLNSVLNFSNFWPFLVHGWPYKLGLTKVRHMYLDSVIFFALTNIKK